MCNLYSATTNQEAIPALFRVDTDLTGNLPPLPGIYPDYAATVVHVREGERTLSMMRWGMPSSQEALFDATAILCATCRADDHCSPRRRSPCCASPRSGDHEVRGFGRRTHRIRSKPPWRSG